MTLTVDPTKPGDLDRAMMMMRSPGDVILAQNGQFTTVGNWGFPDFRSLAKGVSLNATGSRISFSAAYQGSAGGVPRPAKDLNILWGAGDNTVIGGSWDCTPPAGWFGGGLRFSGKFSLSGATVSGLKGDWAFSGPGFTGVEVFAVSGEGATGGSAVENCKVLGVSPNAYVSGIYLGATEDNGIPSMVMNCDVDIRFDNQHAYAATYLTRFVDCKGRGGKYGFYTDTGACIARLQRCELQGSWAAISMVGVGLVRRSVVAEECKLVGGRGVEWWDKTPGSASMDGGVMVSSCDIDAEYLAAVAAAKGSISFGENTYRQPVKTAVGSPGFKPFIA